MAQAFRDECLADTINATQLPYEDPTIEWNDDTKLVIYTDEQRRIIAKRFTSIAMKLNTGLSKRPHLFITIGLDREKSPRALYEQVTTLTPRVAQLNGGIAVMEFIPHSHLHILCDKPAKYHKGNTIKQLARCLGITRLTLIDIQIGSKQEDYDSRSNYIQGIKQNDLKMVRVHEDAIIRQNNNIPHIICL